MCYTQTHTWGDPKGEKSARFLLYFLQKESMEAWRRLTAFSIASIAKVYILGCLCAFASQAPKPVRPLSVILSSFSLKIMLLHCNTVSTGNAIFTPLKHKKIFIRNPAIGITVTGI